VLEARREPVITSRRPTEEDRPLLTVAPRQLVTEVRLPVPSYASVYLRAAQSHVFSFR
jgi:hypothetical protein